MKNALLVFYSDSGHTKLVIDQVAAGLTAVGWQTTIEAITPLDLKPGPWGFLLRAWRAGTRRASIIAPPHNKPADFDLLVVGSPVWGRHLSTPAQGYLKDGADKLPPVALAATVSGSPVEPMVEDIAKITGRAPIAAVAITDKERVNGDDAAKVAAFVAELTGNG